MTRNQSLQNEMQNVERLDGPQHDLTTQESYDPHERVGVESDFSRDFHSGGASRNPEHAGSTGENIVDSLTTGMQAALGGSTTGPVAPMTADSPGHVYDLPANRVTTSQVACTKNAIKLVFASATRLSVVINNRDLANPIYIGANPAVTVNNGFVVDPGASMTMAISCELWAVSPAGALASVMEFIQ